MMRRHRLQRVLRTLLLAAAVPALHTQAQALPTASGPGPYIAIGVAGSAFQSDYGKNLLLAPSVYVDLNVHRRLGLEAEGRWLDWHKQANVSQRTYLAGPRFAPRTRGIQPYAKFLAGVGYMTFPYNYAQGRYFVMAPGAGFEIMLGNYVRVRPVDFEYQIWPQFTYGTMKPYGISTGISVRIF